MYQLSKSFSFEFAHRLPDHDGKCRRLHGHSGLLTVVVKGNDLYTDGPKVGMLLDYGDISSVVELFVGEFLDHHYLNESTGLLNPTSEALAKWVYERLVHKIARLRVDPQSGISLISLKSVSVHETCTSACTFEP